MYVTIMPKIMNLLRIFRRTYADTKSFKTPITVFAVLSLIGVARDGTLSVPPTFCTDYEPHMMDYEPIAVYTGVEGRYVSALYSAAAQMNQLEAVEEHLNKLEDELDKPKVIDFIESSMLSHAAKAKLLQSISKETGMPDAAVNFLTVVAENGRLKMLKKMIAMFLEVMAAHRNEARCEVITAKPLDDSTRTALMSSLEKFVQGKSIQLTETVDPSIIGGFIVGVDDKHIDMSISRRLKMYTDLLQQGI